MMARRKKDTPVHASVNYSSSGIAQCIGLMAVKAFQNPEYMKAFQEWKAAKERETDLQKAI